MLSDSESEELSFPECEIEDAILFSSLIPSFHQREKLFARLKTRYDCNSCSTTTTTTTEYKRDLVQFHMLYNACVDVNGTEKALVEFKNRIYAKVDDMSDDDPFKKKYIVLRARLMSHISKHDWEVFHDTKKTTETDHDDIRSRLLKIKKDLYDVDRTKEDMIIFATLMADMCHDIGETGSDFSDKLRKESVQAYDFLLCKDEKEKKKKMAAAYLVLRKTKTKKNMSTRSLKHVYEISKPLLSIIEYSMDHDISIFYTYIRMVMADICLNVLKYNLSPPHSHSERYNHQVDFIDDESDFSIISFPCSHFPDTKTQMKKDDLQLINRSLDRLKKLLSHVEEFHDEFYRRGYDKYFSGMPMIRGYEKWWYINFKLIMVKWIVYLYHKLQDNDNEILYGMEFYKLHDSDENMDDQESYEFMFFNCFFYEQYLFEDSCNFYSNTWCYSASMDFDEDNDSKLSLDGLKEKILSKFPDFKFPQE